MITLYVKDLINYKLNSIWSLQDKRYNVVFDDGELELSCKRIHISWYYWRFYKIFPGAPTIQEAVVPKDYMTDTHCELSSLIINHIRDSCPNRFNIWDMYKVFCEIGNDLYNANGRRLSEYVTSVAIHDFVEIIEEPHIKEAKEKYKLVVEKCNYEEVTTSKEINKVHKVTENILYSNPEYLSHNGIKKLTRAGLVSKGQMVQLIGPRGYVSDIDGTPFPYPIDNGYFEGLQTLYDDIAESRSASRANMMTAEPLEDSEYMNRRVQLAATVVMDYIDLGPYGCDNYITFDYLVQSEDTELLTGKYYMENNTPILIRNNIEPIIGKVIHLRTFTGCGHIHTSKVCTICLGKKHEYIPPNANLGYELSIQITAKISQDMLSTKHLESSSHSKILELDRHSGKWFRMIGRNTEDLFLAEHYKGTNVIFRIDNSYVKSISQILHIEVTELPLSRLTNIPKFGIATVDNEGFNNGGFDILSLMISGAGVYLTSYVLDYIKEHGWTSEKNYIEFTLSKWDINKPIFHVPRKSDNVMVFFNDFRGFLESHSTAQLRITDYKTRSKALSELIVLLRRRIKSFNLTHVEILVKMLMCASYPSDNYKLPLTNEEFVFKSLDNVIANRSFTAATAFEEQWSLLTGIRFHNKANCVPHLLDPIIEQD